MRLPPGDTKNERCLDMLTNGFMILDHNKKVYFIWITHGWFLDPWKKWVEKMKNSYFTRYPALGEIPEKWDIPSLDLRIQGPHNQTKPKQPRNPAEDSELV